MVKVRIYVYLKYLMSLALKIAKFNLLNISNVILYKSYKGGKGSILKKTECVNKVVAGRTDKEYREDNKDKLREIEK